MSPAPAAAGRSIKNVAAWVPPHLMEKGTEINQASAFKEFLESSSKTIRRIKINAFK